MADTGGGPVDVFERLAEGLVMPDDARALLGLATAHASLSETLTGHAEISQVFTNQAEANKELQERAGHADDVAVLACERSVSSR